MDLRIAYGFPSTLTAPNGAKPQGSRDSAPPANNNPPAVLPSETKPTPGTRLVDDLREETESGIRRTRTYEQPDGRRFTRVEELALTEKGARRSVIQQNPSGNITRYEEVLDRDGSGTFRRTQRFQDESGEVATQITGNYTVTDPFILTDGNAPLSFEGASRFTPSRGTQLDLVA